MGFGTDDFDYCLTSTFSHAFDLAGEIHGLVATAVELDLGLGFGVAGRCDDGVPAPPVANTSGNGSDRTNLLVARGGWDQSALESGLAGPSTLGGGRHVWTHGGGATAHSV